MVVLHSAIKNLLKFFSNTLTSKDFNWKVWFQIILIVLYTRSLLLPRFYSIIDLDNKSIVPQFELTESKNSHNITNKVLLFYKVNSVEAYRLYLYLTIHLALLHHRKKWFNPPNTPPYYEHHTYVVTIVWIFVFVILTTNFAWPIEPLHLFWLSS